MTMISTRQGRVLTTCLPCERKNSLGSSPPLILIRLSVLNPLGELCEYPSVA
ncbi:hypothetical protein CCP3SC15_1220003 [Gammaproteobacteria bacterium]